MPPARIMALRLPMNGARRIYLSTGIRVSATKCARAHLSGSSQRCFSTASTTPPQMHPAARAAAAQAEAQEAIARLRVEEEAMAKERKGRTLWSYVKRSKQPLFNIGVAFLTILMAGNMLHRRAQREKLEGELMELQRRQDVLLGALSNEEWAEGAAKRMGATGGKQGVLRELSTVVKDSMRDVETLQREDLQEEVKARSGSEASGGRPLV